jgi:glutamate-1-semialdehyde 2,1-aminomutase
MKVIAIIQARMGSTRLPDKVMTRILGTPMIELLLRRLSLAGRVDQIILATSRDKRNQELADHVQRLGYPVYRGEENDVLDRYHSVAKHYGPDAIVRITGDCPLIDPALVDEVIRAFEAEEVDYLSNINPPTYPDGLDTEVFSFQALDRAAREATTPADREHVTSFIIESGLFRVGNIENSQDCSDLRWTVDEPMDLEVITNVFDSFYPREDFGWIEVLELFRTRPELFAANQHLARNEGAILGAGQKLWGRAQRVIPGGNMLLSKRPEMFLPGRWPAYFSKAKGCKVWDLDGNEYIDMSVMGVGTNILGYGHPEVDEAVRQAVDAGNMSTLNCPEEVFLAERLVALHPWADMARFARTGGEANAVAVRIARAASGKDKIAFCGYHGWHDWYLAANLNHEDDLSEHLIPGLEPRGVPIGLRDTVYPFHYNRFDELETLVSSHGIGIIKMEVVRNQKPENDFLGKVRKLASDRGIVLIFDECTSGFRQTDGGLHKMYGVAPDMAVFGKALGNGYAITAVIGRKEVMQAAQDTFISSTFWTERIGPTAALKTLEVMGRERTWETITETGLAIGERWQALARKYQLPLALNGLPALVGFSFPLPDSLKYKTLITQEMLKHGFLAGTSVYVCIEHTHSVLERYFDAMDRVFGLIKECTLGRPVDELLETQVCHEGFKRLDWESDEDANCHS